MEKKYILESSIKDICATEGDVCITHLYNIGKHQEIMFYTNDNIIFTQKLPSLTNRPCSDECGLESHELSPLILIMDLG
jgi:hypothetical protein